MSPSNAPTKHTASDRFKQPLRRLLRWLTRRGGAKTKASDPSVCEDQNVDSRDIGDFPTTPGRQQTLASSASTVRTTNALHFHPVVRSSVNTLMLEPLLAEELRCTLFVLYDHQLLKKVDDIPIRWNFPASYDVLVAAATSALSDHGKDSSNHLYRKTGLCRLIRTDNGEQVSSKTLEHQREWSFLASMITNFWSRHPDVNFRVEVEWNFSGLAIQKVENEAYVDTIRAAITAKMQSNWEKKEFIPRRDLNEIMSQGTVAELIDADDTLHDSAFLVAGRPLTKKEFIDHVTAFAYRLLALVVYVRLPLSCLKTLVQAGIEDINMPLDISHCPHEKNNIPEWKWLVSMQGGFRAHEFDGMTPDILNLDPVTVMPIRFNEKTDRIGEGSFGEVFKVTIDCDHHFFSEDKHQYFALKRFFDQGSRTEGDFAKESKMLRALSDYPHEHITPHLALWTQNGKFYMLFPCAENNLRKFLKQANRPTLTKDNVLWLLFQLKGLADGVRRIHNLGPSELGPDLLNKRLHPDAKRGRSGFHHDLKPENILVFAGPNCVPGSDMLGRVLKISDFGSARIGSILSGSGANDRSHKTFDLHQGDAVYGAPDFLKDKYTSRPYDLWSLGCIVLEILVWTFGGDLDHFATERLKAPEALDSHQDSAFWYLHKSGRPRLKPAVERQLQLLKTDCQDRGVFQHLVKGVEELLDVSSKRRPKAPDFCNTLDAIIDQARVDLNGNENHYLQKSFTVRELFAPPSRFDQSSSSRRPSIDERSLDAHLNNNNITSESRDWGNTGELVSNSNTLHVRNASYPTTNDSPSRHSLTPIVTKDILPASARSRSPSISVSNFDEPASAIFSDSGPHDDVRSSGPVSWTPAPFRHDDFIPLQRNKSTSSQSM